MSAITYMTVRNFLRETGMPHTVFGQRAVGDPGLVSDMQRGRQLNANTAEKLRAFIDNYSSSRATRESAAGGAFLSPGGDDLPLAAGPNIPAAPEGGVPRTHYRHPSGLGGQG